MTNQDRRHWRRAVRRAWWSPYPARHHGGIGGWLPGALVAVLLLVLWWAATASGLVAELYLPNPFDVLARMWQQVTSGVAWHYLVPTMSAAALGALFAVAVALPVGWAIAHSRRIAAVAEPFVALSQSVPLVAVAPLLVLWIGYGTVPIAVLCAIVAFFPMITTTVVGLRALDRRIIENAVLDGTSGSQRLWHIEAPMAAPAVLAGIRGGVVLAMTGAIVGELVMGGTAGLGTLLTLVRDSADTAGIFAVVAWISLAAMLCYALVRIAELAAVARLEGEES